MSNTPDGLGKAVALIQQAAAEAVTAQNRVAIVPLPEDDDGRFYLVQQGQAELHLPPAALITGSLLSVDQAAACAYVYGAALIMIDGDTVTVTLDRTDARQFFSCRLSLSPQFSTLRDLKHSSFSQREFLELLRITLAGALDDSGQRLIQFVRKFQVDRSESTQAELKRDRESLGRSVQAEVRSEAGDMPESLTVFVRVFADRALQRRVAIPCLVDFSPATHDFRLIPEPDALLAATDTVLLQIGDLIESGLDRFYGDTDQPADQRPDRPAVLFGSF